MRLITPLRNSASVTHYVTQITNDHEYLSEQETVARTWGHCASMPCNH